MGSIIPVVELTRFVSFMHYICLPYMCAILSKSSEHESHWQGDSRSLDNAFDGAY